MLRPVTPSTLEEKLRLRARQELQGDLDNALKGFERFNARHVETRIIQPNGKPYEVWQLLQAVECAIFDALAPALEERTIEALLDRVDALFESTKELRAEVRANLGETA